MNWIEYYERFLKFCPECGKELELCPISNEIACFLHGNFIIREDKLIWNYTKNLIARN